MELRAIDFVGNAARLRAAHYREEGDRFRTMAEVEPIAANLTDNDRADLARFLVDRYPLSPRMRRLKALLAKIDLSSAPAGALKAGGATESRAGEEAAPIRADPRRRARGGGPR
jgi:hypothetical protein